jgi:hypothetical protein
MCQNLCPAEVSACCYNDSANTAKGLRNQGFDPVCGRKEIGIADALCMGAIPAGLKKTVKQDQAGGSI